MNNLSIKKLPLLLSFIFLSLVLTAQKGWESGPSVGLSSYFGDLNTSFSLRAPGISGGINARYNFNNRLCLKFSGKYAEISADDSFSKNVFEKQRNLSFESILFDATTQFEFNFLPYTHGSREEFFTPYLFGGFSAFYYNPQAVYQGELYDLRELGTEGQFKGEEYLTFSGAYTYGIGLKFDLSYRWSLNVELGMRSTFTDYLDDVSTVYPDNGDLQRSHGEVAAALSDRTLGEENPLSRTGRQRGTSSSNDIYGIFDISLMYYFGSITCPQIGRPGARF